MPRRTPWLLALLLFAAGPAPAQEAKPGPAIEVRAASVNDLLVAAKFLGESLNQGGFISPSNGTIAQESIPN